MPPVIGAATPVVVGKVSGNPKPERTARNAKASASMLSAEIPRAFADTTMPESILPSAAMRAELRLPPPATIHEPGCSGMNCAERLSAFAVNSVNVAAPSATLNSFRQSSRKAFLSRVFGGSLEKKGLERRMSRQASLTHPCFANRPSRSNVYPVCRDTQSSNRALPGPVSNASNSLFPPIHVTLATPPILTKAAGRRTSHNSARVR